ncbi:polyhomeotic-proximal chromatin protein-like isoform X2 [Anthonomus grandis grandis]|uniref:polyhomeotic-proximal chromatin protein-like isoform X2 n=1 Tax=Anthonomus grandis grandis TaxID=2921223 RepID=UPI00216609B1|nr:polyhomeotic-proximal chromatin protein-like isoform X2 [Anthonomus grandis grandis]
MSQTPNKQLQKMCKSPKSSSTFQIKQEKIDYENMSTNCTVVGSNNLNLVKKPQLMANMSPAYSNPSPNYHPQSPYSSPASLKSPSPSLKPPTPQPNFPVMQIIHNNLISRPIQTSQAQNIIKLKPHLNILPKPSASPQPSPKPSVSPQIVIPAANQTTATATATLMQTPQPLLLNQMPMLAAPGVQFILRPQTATPMATAAPKLQATSQSPQGLILQPACGTQQLLQLGGPARSQPMVRVLTNGMQFAPATSTTYVTTQMANQPINATHIQQTIVNSQQQAQQQQHIQIQQQLLKKKPKVKVKKRLDLANIMKLSGIGDEDDIQFESDTSQSESEHNSVPTTPQPVPQNPQQVPPASPSPFDPKKNIQNIQISAAVPQPTINPATPVVQVLNQNFQGSMISNNPPPTAQASPFNSTFITPNFTINNGLMLQRSGGFKLTVGDDGRLMLQHDPTLNQDIQSQLILQSLLGLNGLVLQPSMDQQTVQQTVQTIQQQSVQTIQQQTVQSQTIQTVQQQTVQPQVQHTLQSLQPQIQQQTVQQTIQHQTVNALQQPMQIVQPQPIHSLHSQVQPTVHSISQSQVHNLQSQIQSLLAQQNVVQAQAVHQNVPHSVHSQAMQSVQNLAQSSVMAQNVQNLAQSSVQNVVAQNLAQSAVLSQNVSQNASVQNVVAQNLAQNMTAAQSSVLSQNMSQNASVQNVLSQNMSQNASVQNVLSQNMSQSASVQNVVAQNMQNIQSVQPTQTQNVPQSSVHTVQGFQQAHTQTSQPILKVQPFQKSQPPVQTVQPIQNLSHQHQHQNMQEQQNQQSGNNNPTSYVVNLTPDQLEQLKRNGQVTVNGQTIFMQRPNKDQNEKKLSPKMKPVKKVHKIQAAPFKPLPQDHQNNAQSDNATMIDRKPNLTTLDHNVKSPSPVAHTTKPMSSPVQPVPQQQPQQQQPPQKQLHTVLPHSHVPPIQPTKQQQPQAMVQPSIQHHQAKMERQKPQITPKQQKVSPTIHSLQQESGNSGNGSSNSHEVDKLLGQILEETNNPDLLHYRNNNTPNNNNNTNGGERQQQRITTIQLTPQKQQHLKNIQMQIQSLSARLQSGDTEVHNTLKVLFAEQQKILATGKLLPPDKVYYLNNQLTIVNPSSLNLPSPASSIKSEPPSPGLQVQVSVPRSTSSDTTSTVNHQPITTVSQLHQPTAPRVSVSVSTSTGDLPLISPATLPSTIHHHPTTIVTSQQNQHHPAIMTTSHVANAQATAQAIHNHQNHVIGQRLGIMGQVPQLPPLYPKPHPTIQHSPKLHSPQLHSPKLHSPKLHSPQLPSPQPGQLQSAATNPTQPLNHVQTVPQAIKPKIQQASGNKATLQSQQQPTPSQQLFQQHYQQQQLLLSQQQQKEAQRLQLVAQQQKQQQEQQMSLAKKAHLIESQYQLDQQGASKPDLQKPFRDKREACIRLIRYHCYDQPVLSEQDLSKADEIFEVTAKHFIAKFDRMNDKYKYLLMKESMRQVQTSELMMLDRMFLADEQQSLIRLRQDYETELHNLTTPTQASETLPGRGHYDSEQDKRHGMQNGPMNREPGDPPTNSEEYDEWACIQRELGCLPPDHKDPNNHHNNHHHHNHHHHHSSTPIHHHHLHNHLKRTSSSDSRLETLKRFRVDKKKHDAMGVVSVSPGQSKCGYESATSSQANSSKEEESDCTNNSIDEQVQSAINSILNLQQQQQQSLDLDGLLS